MNRFRELVIGESPGVARAGGSGSEERVLRAKYLDWCSARIAERFLQLTPEEIYALAELASRDESESSRDAVVVSGSGDDPPFRWVVGRVTESLAAQLQLPTLEEWSRSYAADPERYDTALLGLWKESG